MAAQSENSTTVVVACKLPNGFFMTTYDIERREVALVGGGTAPENKVRARGAKIKINGNAALQGESLPWRVESGYAMTPDVPGDIARLWFEQNRETMLVENRVVFWASKMEDAVAKAKEYKAMRSGLERLDVGTIRKEGRDVPADPRWPVGLNPNLGLIQTHTEKDQP